VASFAIASWGSIALWLPRRVRGFRKHYGFANPLWASYVEWLWMAGLRVTSLGFETSTAVRDPLTGFVCGAAFAKQEWVSFLSWLCRVSRDQIGARSFYGFRVNAMGFEHVTAFRALTVGFGRVLAFVFREQRMGFVSIAAFRDLRMGFVLSLAVLWFGVFAYIGCGFSRKLFFRPTLSADRPSRFGFR